MVEAFRFRFAVVIIMLGMSSCALTDRPLREINFNVRPEAKIAFLNGVKKFAQDHQMVETVVAPLSSNRDSTHIVLKGRQSEITVSNNALDSSAPNLFSVAFYRPPISLSGESAVLEDAAEFQQNLLAVPGVSLLQIEATSTLVGSESSSSDSSS